jgi:LDH2 family malate/lactate/ureidoglycolate dehydrogenase
MSQAYKRDDLVDWATRLLAARGLATDKAATVASVLVEGDLLGHDTHGLALLGPYARKVDEGVLAKAGDVTVVSDLPAAKLWDGNHLPGPWLTVTAIEAASTAARTYGTATVAVRRSGHIACLASYLEKPARAGLVVEILSSDPSVATVAPYGGTRPTFTPNPLAFGIPTGGDPIMIDISASITTNGMSARLHKQGQRFPAPWLLDATGRPTDDPGVLEADPPGTIQLLGGTDVGHKGYGLALLVEAMTGGLAAHGRAEAPTDWGATFMVRVSDPAAFGGLDGFNRELDWLVAACQENPPANAERPVRLPGSRGLALKKAALANGLTLHPDVEAQVRALAEEAAIALPAPITS